MGSRGQRSLPPPAPPAERTAGQLVGESMRLYGRRLWMALLLGVPPTLAGIGVAAYSDSGASRRAVLILALGTVVPAFSLSYVGAVVVATDTRPPRRNLIEAFLIGVLILLPVPFLSTLVLPVLPALAWLSLFGLAVPVAVIERAGLRPALARAFQLARADYVHSLGSLAAAALVVLLSAGVLRYLLVQFGDTAAGVAAFIAILLLSPLMVFAAALLYFDQAARAAPVREGLTSPRARRGK